MDAITLLKDDHKTVEALFKRFEKAGDERVRAEARDRRSDHRGALDPRRRRGAALLPGRPGRPCRTTEDVALESLEEHHIVKWVLSELEKMDPKDERFDAKVTVLMENVRHHVEEEEERVLPEGARRARPQRPQRPRRRDGGRQEGRRPRIRTPARQTRRPAT